MDQAFEIHAILEVTLIGDDSINIKSNKNETDRNLEAYKSIGYDINDSREKQKINYRTGTEDNDTDLEYKKAQTYNIFIKHDYEYLKIELLDGKLVNTNRLFIIEGHDHDHKDNVLRPEDEETTPFNITHQNQNHLSKEDRSESKVLNVKSYPNIQIMNTMYKEKIDFIKGSKINIYLKTARFSNLDNFYYIKITPVKQNIQIAVDVADIIIKENSIDGYGIGKLPAYMKPFNRMGNVPSYWEIYPERSSDRKAYGYVDYITIDATEYNKKNIQSIRGVRLFSKNTQYSGRVPKDHFEYHDEYKPIYTKEWESFTSPIEIHLNQKIQYTRIKIQFYFGIYGWRTDLGTLWSDIPPHIKMYNFNTHIDLKLREVNRNNDYDKITFAIRKPGTPETEVTEHLGKYNPNTRSSTNYTYSEEYGSSDDILLFHYFKLGSSLYFNVDPEDQTRQIKPLIDSYTITAKYNYIPVTYKGNFAISLLQDIISEKDCSSSITYDYPNKKITIRVFFNTEFQGFYEWHTPTGQKGEKYTEKCNTISYEIENNRPKDNGQYEISFTVSTSNQKLKFTKKIYTIPSRVDPTLNMGFRFNSYSSSTSQFQPFKELNYFNDASDVSFKISYKIDNCDNITDISTQMKPQLFRNINRISHNDSLTIETIDTPLNEYLVDMSNNAYKSFLDYTTGKFALEAESKKYNIKQANKHLILDGYYNELYDINDHTILFDSVTEWSNHLVLTQDQSDSKLFFIYKDSFRTWNHIRVTQSSLHNNVKLNVEPWISEDTLNHKYTGYSYRWNTDIHNTIIQEPIQRNEITTFRNRSIKEIMYPFIIDSSLRLWHIDHNRSNHEYSSHEIDAFVSKATYLGKRNSTHMEDYRDNDIHVIYLQKDVVKANPIISVAFPDAQAILVHIDIVDVVDVGRENTYGYGRSTYPSTYMHYHTRYIHAHSQDKIKDYNSGTVYDTETVPGTYQTTEKRIQIPIRALVPWTYNRNPDYGVHNRIIHYTNNIIFNVIKEGALYVGKAYKIYCMPIYYEPIKITVTPLFVDHTFTKLYTDKNDKLRIANKNDMYIISSKDLSKVPILVDNPLQSHKDTFKIIDGDGSYGDASGTVYKLDNPNDVWKWIESSDISSHTEWAEKSAQNVTLKGSQLTVNGTPYSFGHLAHDLYNLKKYIPKNIPNYRENEELSVVFSLTDSDNTSSNVTVCYKGTFKVVPETDIRYTCIDQETFYPFEEFVVYSEQDYYIKINDLSDLTFTRDGTNLPFDDWIHIGSQQTDLTDIEMKYTKRLIIGKQEQFQMNIKFSSTPQNNQEKGEITRSINVTVEGSTVSFAPEIIDTSDISYIIKPWESNIITGHFDYYDMDNNVNSVQIIPPDNNNDYLDSKHIVVTELHDSKRFKYTITLPMPSLFTTNNYLVGYKLIDDDNNSDVVNIKIIQEGTFVEKNPDYTFDWLNDTNKMDTSDIRVIEIDASNHTKDIDDTIIRKFMSDYLVGANYVVVLIHQLEKSIMISTIESAKAPNPPSLYCKYGISPSYYYTTIVQPDFDNADIHIFVLQLHTKTNDIRCSIYNTKSELIDNISELSKGVLLTKISKR